MAYAIIMLNGGAALTERTNQLLVVVQVVGFGNAMDGYRFFGEGSPIFGIKKSRQFDHSFVFK